MMITIIIMTMMMTMMMIVIMIIIMIIIMLHYCLEYTDGGSCIVVPVGLIKISKTSSKF